MLISNSRDNLKQFTARVLSNKAVVRFHDTTYHLMSVEYTGNSKGCLPGQFFMLQCGDEVLLRRPVSIHSVEPGKLYFLYSVQEGDTLFSSTQGQGLRWLVKRTKGHQLNLIGPQGNGFRLDKSGRNLLIVAGGIGIAPLKYLAESALLLKKKVSILMGARTAAALYPQDMLPTGVKLIIATDDGSRGRMAAVSDLLPEHTAWADSVFSCGPLAMYRSLADKLDACHFKGPVQVSLEVRMGCGFGVCYGCSIKTRQGMKRVCQEGPVFNIKDIIWQEVKI